MNTQWRLNRNRLRWGVKDLPVGFILVTLALFVAMVFGGASRGNAIQVMIAQIAGVPALLWGIWRLLQDPARRRYLFPLLILAAMVLVALIQLIPLPPTIWAAWPGHGPIAAGLNAAGIEIGWRTISLAPGATWSHALALLPPAAIFVAGLQLSERERIWLAGLIVVIAFLSLTIGVVQIAGSDEGPLYFYNPTNNGSAVGLFSNRNHQAALLVVCLPFAALCAALARKNGTTKQVLVMAAALSMFLITIIGLVIVKSRAGVFLLAPAIVASFLILRRNDKARGDHFLTLLGAGTLVVIGLAAAFGMGPLMERFSDGTVDGRGLASATVFQVAREYLPLGSGIGSFVPVYNAVEPLDTMSHAYWNHAHNDYAELWLEAGVLAGVIFLAFMVWWTRAAWSAWRAVDTPLALMARASTVVTAVLLIHSTVDYPLRTLTMACVLAFALSTLASYNAVSQPQGADKR